MILPVKFKCKRQVCQSDKLLWQQMCVCMCVLIPSYLNWSVPSLNCIFHFIIHTLFACLCLLMKQKLNNNNTNVPDCTMKIISVYNQSLKIDYFWIIPSLENNLWALTLGLCKRVCMWECTNVHWSCFSHKILVGTGF